MNERRKEGVAITGIGMITPLGDEPAEVLHRIQVGHSAATGPTGFDETIFPCPVCAPVKSFEPVRYVSEPKMVRLMNRDAQLAVAAARLALEDAGLESGAFYQPQDIALFGATGLAGLPLREIVPLIRVSTAPEGGFDLARFSQAGLKAVSPILSFKILSNMPLCFVSINENIQGPNAIYTPWEGDGAEAIEAGIRALKTGDARCALVGGCDVKIHELAFATLHQHDLFSSWRETGNGMFPGEGAVFLVLENRTTAEARRAHIYGLVAGFSLRPHSPAKQISRTRTDVLSALTVGAVDALVSSKDGDPLQDPQKQQIFEATRITVKETVSPKKHLGNLFAAAGPLQLALAAVLTNMGRRSVLANCFGYGRTQASFVLASV